MINGGTSCYVVVHGACFGRTRLNFDFKIISPTFIYLAPYLGKKKSFVVDDWNNLKEFMWTSDLDFHNDCLQMNYNTS